MMPVIFRIPFVNIDVPGFGLMLMIAFLASILWAVRRAERSRANPDVILNLGFVALICGVVGCRLMYVVHYWDQFRDAGSPVQVLWAIVDIRRGGVEFYGGFILTVLVTIIWLKWIEKVSLRWYLDICAPSLALGLAIGRIGCFLNGCCYGSTCDLPWALKFPFGSPAQVEQWQHKLPGSGVPEQLLLVNGSGAARPIARETLAAAPAEIDAAYKSLEDIRTQQAEIQRKLATASDAEKPVLQAKLHELEQRQSAFGLAFQDMRVVMTKYGLSQDQVRALAAKYPSLPVHPTQLYSTITALLVALLLNSWYWRRTRDGQVILGLFAIEPITRILLEMIRDDNPVDVFGALTISQWLGILMTALGILGLLVLRGMRPRSAAATPFAPVPAA